jgi:hypothetical protein
MNRREKHSVAHWRVIKRNCTYLPEFEPDTNDEVALISSNQYADQAYYDYRFNEFYAYYLEWKKNQIQLSKECSLDVFNEHCNKIATNLNAQFFLCGTHTRLGENSPIKMLNDDILSIIFSIEEIRVLDSVCNNIGMNSRLFRETYFTKQELYTEQEYCNILGCHSEDTLF